MDSSFSATEFTATEFTATGQKMTRDRCAVVLGGTGFVGLPVCRALSHLGYDVVVIARRAAPVEGVSRIVSLDLGDVDPEEIATVLREAHAGVVVNAAGGMWGLTDEQMVAANLTLVQNVIAAASTVPSRPRLVQLGSVHEYGLVPVGTSMAEDTAAKPVNAYAELKLRCTEAVVDASARGLIDGVSLRIGNVIGAGQPSVSLLGVVARQLWAAHQERRPAVLQMGSLTAQRDFISLSSAVTAIVAAATIPELPARVFNIGTGKATSAREMVRLLIEVSGVSAELNEAAPAEPVESLWQQMRVDRAGLLGWSPSVDLSDGMKELWEHHATHAPMVEGVTERR